MLLKKWMLHSVREREPVMVDQNDSAQFLDRFNENVNDFLMAKSYDVISKERYS